MKSTGTVLLDQTAQLEDIFWGFYKWLDDHTTETLIVSVKVDNGANSATLQQKVYDLVTGQDVNAYWVQSATVSDASYFWIVNLMQSLLVPYSRRSTT
jgi:hypothetical protein